MALTSDTPLRLGDLLFAGSGETKEDIGKCTAFFGRHEAYAGGDIVIFRPHAGPSRFLAYALNSRDAAKQKTARAQGDAVVHIYPDGLSTIKIALPPLAEQEAIAEALSDADGVIEGLERLIAKKRLIKQGAMQDLLTAKRRLPGFSGEWDARPFGQIARIRNQKISTFGDSRASCCIELEQIQSETGRLLDWTSAVERRTTKYLFEPDDTLFGRLRPYLRKFFQPKVQGVCSTEIWPLVPCQVAPNFLYATVQSERFIAAASESYGTHMPRADWSKLSEFEVAVPKELEEQQSIGDTLNNMDTEIAALEARLEKARLVKEGMMQNLLTGRIRLE